MTKSERALLASLRLLRCGELDAAAADKLVKRGFAHYIGGEAFVNSRGQETIGRLTAAEFDTAPPCDCGGSGTCACVDGDCTCPRCAG